MEKIADTSELNLTNNTDTQNAHILATVTFHYRDTRIEYLEQVLRGLMSFPIAHLDAIVVTNTCIEQELDVLAGLCQRLSTHGKTCIAKTYQGFGHPYSLTWCHKELIRDTFLAEGSKYTHFLYLEDDIGFNFENFSYFAAYRQELSSFGLIPAFLRVEYNEDLKTYVNSDNRRPVNLSQLPLIRTKDYIFANLPNPYNAMFLMDVDLAREYIASRSFHPEKSTSVAKWGIRERAAMGLTFENVPRKFSARYVVPISLTEKMPPKFSWVYHLPNTYAQDPETRRGKLPVSKLFSLPEEKNLVTVTMESEPPPSQAISKVMHMIREAPLEKLVSEDWVQHHLLPAAGFDERVIPYVPNTVREFCGSGMRLFQSPNQYSKYLCYLARKQVSSYVEIGTLHGGTFVVTVEYLSRFHPITEAVAVDVQINGPLEEYATMNSSVKLSQGSLSDAPIIDLLKGRLWDLVLMDIDASDRGYRADYLTVRDHARIVALRDTCNDARPSVGILWKQIKNAVPGRFVREFHEQYPEVPRKKGRRYFGIGLVDWSTTNVDATSPPQNTMQSDRTPL